MFKRFITAFFLTVLSIILLFSAAFAYLIVTPLGGKILVRYFKKEFVAVGLMHIGHYEGTLQNGFILKDIRIKGLSYFPDALVRIQEIRVHLPLWDLPHSDFGIFNARIFMPPPLAGQADSDPVVFTGEIYAGQINGNLYARSVDIQATTRFCTSDYIRQHLHGFISNIDARIQGPLSAPVVNGSFLADNVQYKSIVLTDVMARVNLVLLSAACPLQMNGEVIIDSGSANVRKVNFRLSRSKFIFKGDVLSPTIDIHLGAKVEDMDFHLMIKGSSVNPQMTVTSDPPMAPQDALNVLFTGNAWSASTSPFYGVTSSELAENFLNYSLQDINDQQQLGFKTKLSDNLKLGAEMDQMPSTPGETNIYYSRKINGEMDLSDHMSLNVSREVFAQDSYPSYQDAQPEDDTQIYVQYKKRF